MATVHLKLVTVNRNEIYINSNVPSDFKTWTKENQLMELAMSRTITDVLTNTVYYTKNLVSVQIVED